MIEHWQRSVVVGIGEDFMATEVVLHKRGQDAMKMAMRRNPMMPTSSRVEVRTMEAFHIERAEDARRTGADIPRDDRQGEEFDW